MSVLPSESRDAQATSLSQPAQKSLDDDAVSRDNTTLKFEGRMSVYDDETGGDPYNRRGRFRRVIR